MSFLKEQNLAGVDVIDEIVRCNEAVVCPDGVTRYRGYLCCTADSNVQGNDSVSYGVWTAAAKGGTRLVVALAGYPADGTQVVIDRWNGWVWATAATTYYVRYLAHAPITHHPNNLDLNVPYLLPAGAAVTIAQSKESYFRKFGYAAIDVQGGAPSADATLTISNGTESATATIAAGTGQTLAEFAAPLKVTAAETLTVSVTDGKNAFGVRIRLLDV